MHSAEEVEVASSPGAASFGIHQTCTDLGLDDPDSEFAMDAVDVIAPAEVGCWIPPGLGNGFSWRDRSSWGSTQPLA